MRQVQAAKNMPFIEQARASHTFSTSFAQLVEKGKDRKKPTRQTIADARLHETPHSPSIAEIMGDSNVRVDCSEVNVNPAKNRRAKIAESVLYGNRWARAYG
jgi:hypothetical protein